MNDGIDPVFYGFICAVTLWLALLWIAARFSRGRQGRALKVGFGLATVLVLFVPVGGMPVWSLAFSLCPNPSLPMLGMVFAALWQHLCGVAVFKPADWRATWIFGAVAGTVLYLHPWFFGAVDLYYWGWDQEIAVWAIAAMAVLLLAWGNRLGVLFLGALIAFELEALESHNCWDYIIDPFYWLISLGLCGGEVFRWWRSRPGRRAALMAVDAPSI